MPVEPPKIRHNRERSLAFFSPRCVIQEKYQRLCPTGIEAGPENFREPEQHLHRHFPAFLPESAPAQREIVMTKRILRVLLVAGAGMLLMACSPKIYGRVQLVDPAMKPIVGDTSEGTVINMINTTSALENASHSVSVNVNGEFESEKDKVNPGMYKVEASRIGYQTETQTVEVGRFSRKELEIKLKKVVEGKRRSIEGARIDADKIVNPGEVNIQPPTM